MIDRFKGVSMFVCNSERGRSVFNAISEKIDVFPMKWEDIKNENRFSEGGIIPKEREELLALIRKGFDKAVKTMLNPLYDWKRLLYYRLPAFIRKKISGQ